MFIQSLKLISWNICVS